jgi:hypothetical protein
MGNRVPNAGAAVRGATFLGQEIIPEHFPVGLRRIIGQYTVDEQEVIRQYQQVAEPQSSPARDFCAHVADYLVFVDLTPETQATLFVKAVLINDAAVVNAVISKHVISSWLTQQLLRTLCFSPHDEHVLLLDDLLKRHDFAPDALHEVLKRLFASESSFAKASQRASFLCDRLHLDAKTVVRAAYEGMSQRPPTVVHRIVYRDDPLFGGFG